MESLVWSAVDCGRTNLSKGNSPTYVFLEISKVFGAAILKHPHENICGEV